MVNLAQVRDRARMLALFAGGLEEALDPCRFGVSRTRAAGTSFEICPGLALDLTRGALSPGDHAVVANAARLLGLLLEKREQEEHLAEAQLRLEDRVAARTAELAQSAERFQRLFESNAGGVLVHDASGAITRVNAEGCRLLGLRRDLVLGRYSQDPQWRTVWEDGRPASGDEHPSSVAFRTGRSVRNVVMGLYPGEEALRWLLISAEPVRDAAGDVLEVIVTFQDVTAVKEAEAEKRRLEAQLLQAQKLESLGVLAGGIAHDFNNLLTGVLGGASLARQDLPPGSPAEEELTRIEAAARQAADLTRRLLAYAGKAPTEVQPLDLSALVRETVPLLQLAGSKKCAVRLDLRPDLVVLADRAQLRQVVMNLAINGAEAVGEAEGAVDLRTRVEPCSQARLRSARLPSDRPAGPFVVLEVADTGCGMNEATLARIFDPFFSTKFTGRGLGLPSVLGIVRGHGGALELESAVGRGTTFRLLLPVAGEAQDSSPRPGPAAQVRAGHGAILVADDEAIVRTLARRVLSRAGFEVLEAADGRAALDLISARDDLRLVLLDSAMPRLSGPEALTELASQRRRPRVLLSSGHPELGEDRRILDLGIAGFLAKPYTAAELLQAVFAALDAPQRAPVVGPAP